jgi:SAM-dependent methyltransferase
VEAAGAAGIVAEGVEVSGAAVRFARERLGVRLRQGRFESATVAQPVAAVCAFHVLEHVEDPNEFLSAARRALLPGGRLALEVPNIASAAARRLGTGWPHIEPRYHRWHFTPESLTRLVTAHGFQVVRRDTVFSRFYWRPWARLTHARDLFIADWVASRRASVRHPTLGDALRLVARHTNGSRPV